MHFTSSRLCPLFNDFFYYFGQTCLTQMEGNAREGEKVESK